MHAFSACPIGLPRATAAPPEKSGGKPESAVDFERGENTHEVETDGTLQLSETVDGMELLEDIFSALTNAQFEIRRAVKKLHGREFAMQDEINDLKAALEDKTRRWNNAQLALEERTTKAAILEAERDTAVLDAMKARKREKREEICVCMRSRVKTQRTLQAFDAIVITLQHQQQKQEAESNVFERVARAQLTLRNIEQTKLQRELNIARESLQHEKNRFHIELENAMMERDKKEKHLEIVKSERDAFKRERDDAMLALDVQKTMVEQLFKENLSITKSLTVALSKKRRLETDLIVAAEEVAEERIRLDQAHNAALEQARSEFRELEANLLESVTRKTSLEAELICLEERCSKLEADRQAVQNCLDDEKEKSLCQICFESPKNSIAFPCLHLNFCFPCLESHRADKNSCPTCRTAINGVLKCVIC